MITRFRPLHYTYGMLSLAIIYAFSPVMAAPAQAVDPSGRIVRPSAPQSGATSLLEMGEATALTLRVRAVQIWEASQIVVWVPVDSSPERRRFVAYQTPSDELWRLQRWLAENGPTEVTLVGVLEPAPRQSYPSEVIFRVQSITWEPSL